MTVTASRRSRECDGSNQNAIDFRNPARFCVETEFLQHPRAGAPPHRDA